MRHSFFFFLQLLYAKQSTLIPNNTMISCLFWKCVCTLLSLLLLQIKLQICPQKFSIFLHKLFMFLDSEGKRTLDADMYTSMIATEPASSAKLRG